MMTNELINEKIAALKALEEASSALNKQIDAIKSELKAELDVRKVDAVDTDLHKVFYSCYEKASIDTNKLKSAGLYDEYSKKSVVIQFKITDKKLA